ncbi:hypothetical protein DPMN_178404 [Dreissena polymorpha]|uniref:Uncharacterized protein n=1 Tax=Dreissena polymorpha TaxID=45954 RepID=A0A9D4EEZ6_DREPO|nr:hypothetical protein DPMN_178404 [Dreissena polymorpha]
MFFCFKHPEVGDMEPQEKTFWLATTPLVSRVTSLILTLRNQPRRGQRLREPVCQKLELEVCLNTSGTKNPYDLVSHDKSKGRVCTYRWL